MLKNEVKFYFNKEEDILPNWHQEIEIVFILKGSGILKNEYDKYKNKVEKGDVFVINSFEIHTLDMEEDSNALSLFISNEFINKFASEIYNYKFQCQSYLYPKNSQHNFNILRKNYADIFKIIYKNENFSAIDLRSKIGILLNTLMKYFSRKNAETTNNKTGREKLRYAVNYINKNYKEPITLKEIAKNSFLSDTYLSRLFQQEIGTTYTDYITNIRLLSAENLLITDKTITEIAFEAGFPNTNAMIDAFKIKYNLTPGQYRDKNKKDETINNISSTDLSKHDNISVAFTTLTKYLVESEKKTEEKTHGAIVKIDANMKETGKKLKHTWKNIINSGYAKEILGGNLQKQIIDLQKNIGFKYLRFRGILDDDMRVYSEDIEGNPIFNFTYVNELINFLLNNNITPFLELSYMPSMLSSLKKPFFRRISYISMPNNYEKWKKLIEAFMENLINNFGISEIKKWIFSIWNTPEMSEYGLYTLTEYMKLYETTYKIIKKYDSKLRIAGFGHTLGNESDFEQMFTESSKKGCLPDILCFHFYYGEVTKEDEGVEIFYRNDAFPIVTSKDSNYFKKSIERVKILLKKLNVKNTPIIIDEWSNTIWQRDLSNDTSYKSSFLFKNILDNYDDLDGIAYWTLSDHMSELPLPEEIFHGGFGLFTKEGIKKPAYRALELICKIGNNLVKKDEGYFISEKSGEFQIFLYNYSHYDTLYRYRHATNISQTNRFDIYNQKENLLFNIRLKGMKDGTYKIEKYIISRDEGSTYGEWLKMGAPLVGDRHIIKRLKERSYPAYEVITEKIKDVYSIKTVLSPHEVQLITIKKI